VCIQARHQQTSVPLLVSRQLNRLRVNTEKLIVERGPKDELKSFGAYLGNFDNPPTRAQATLLLQWDVLVLDPMAEGVAEALAIYQPSASHILGRLDLTSIISRESSTSSDDVIQCLQVIAQKVTTHYRSPFTGILLSGVYSHLQPPVLNEVAKWLNGLGLDVWLELAYPAYLSERQARDINMKFIRGIVYRNGTIRPDGEQQNYFQMNEMRTVMRAVAAQRVVHGPPQIMWDAIDDEVDLDYAVIQRGFVWCQYSSSLCWIGRSLALYHSEVAAAQTISEKPLGALMWLKGDDIMKAHDHWRTTDEISQSSVGYEELYDSLAPFIPNLRSKLRLTLPQNTQGDNQLSTIDYFNCGRETQKYVETNPLSVSSDGNSFTGLGCFQLGLEVNQKNYEDIVHIQRGLKDLNLLLPIEGEELQTIIEHVRNLQLAQVLGPIHSPASQAVRELLGLLVAVNEEGVSHIKIYSGLHSGFQTSSGIQFMGVSDFDASTDTLDIYLSNKTGQHRAGTILHTYLSSRGCTRTECLMAELALAKQTGSMSKRWELPNRIMNDLEGLSPQETVLFLKRLIPSTAEDDSVLLRRIRACCEHQLIDVPSHKQLRTMSAIAYLSGEISVENLVSARLSWLREQGCWVPSNEASVALFHEVDARVYEILMRGDNTTLAKLGLVITTILKDQVDAGVDIFALSVFSAFRKLALDEVYLEVMDRNPLPNHATDQAGIFAENFALGSRCDSFFDMTARDVGRIIAHRYRAYYMKHQPPRRPEIFTELPTAYSAMQIDSDPSDGAIVLPWYYHVTFLGIFAVPALIDVTLLTTIGRGLYLTTFMSDTEKTMATSALMVSLLVCGAVGAWISSGGSYYFYANAFPAMNMFVLTRFAAGLAITIVCGIAGMVGLMIAKSVIAGLIFLYYFVMLTTYLLTLSALSIYQLPGNRFQSGRTVILSCIPILFISPILTIWVKNDIAVYFTVLSCFLAALLWGARKVISQWSTFYLHIPSTSDVQILEWYAKRQEGKIYPDAIEGMYDEELLPQARRKFYSAINKEMNRSWWQPRTKDPLIKKMADGYHSTSFLMMWYCRFKRTPMPLPYSTTWNLTVSAALEMMTGMQKGLKLHSAFLHWRHTGADIWSGLLYFVVALTDKWVVLFCGGGLVGLSAAANAQYRLAVGFGLVYYLLGAVSLDAVSMPLYTLANEATMQPITSLEFLRQATKNDKSARRRLYWNNLVKFFFVHIWAIAVTAALMWSFEAARQATIMYVGYIGAYTGLLWYQYNKIFCAQKAGQSLALAAAVGFPVGMALYLCLPSFAFGGVIGLGVGTWVAAIHSIFLTKVGLPTFRKPASEYDPVDKDGEFKELKAVFSCTSLEPYPELSQKTLGKIFHAIGTIPEEQRYRILPQDHPGIRVYDTLKSRSHANRSKTLNDAFSSDLLDEIAEHWKDGRIGIQLVSARDFPQYEQKVRAIHRSYGEQLDLYIILGPDLVAHEWTLNINRNYKIISEAIVQAVCETQFGFSHDHSMLAELLVLDVSEDDALGIPEGIKRQLETSSVERTRILDEGSKTLLRYLLLGIDCEREWEFMPHAVRRFLIRRISGQNDNLTFEIEQWIRSRICSTDSIDVASYVARCDIGASLTIAVNNYAKVLEEHGTYHEDESEFLDSTCEKLIGSPPAAVTKDSGFSAPIKHLYARLCQQTDYAIKFFCLALTADPDYQRELDYVLKGQLFIIRWPITIALNLTWSLCKLLQRIVVPFALFHGRPNVARLSSNMKGMKTVVEKKRITIESLAGNSTCFTFKEDDKSIRLSQYSGLHTTEPSDPKTLMAINTYSKRMILQHREEYKAGKLLNVFAYDYAEGRSRGQLPMQRHCIEGALNGQIVQYDDRGYITMGSSFRGVNPVEFTYWYRKNAKFEDELLRGEYILPHVTIRVNWSMPPRTNRDRLDNWIPYSMVTEATFIQGADIYHATWDYEHKFHPDIHTTLNGEPVETPAMIAEDWFAVIDKPEKCGFLSDNPLLSFRSPKSNFVSRMLGLNYKRYPIPTSTARTQLWKIWKDTNELDAITSRWIDERLLRSDKILNSYWRNRDIGRLDAARQYLDDNADTIMARVDIDQMISSWVHIAFKMSDFYSMGQGGDSRINTRTLGSQIKDDYHELHILAMDTSTWPNDPGGVSACRRDMVNDLKTIKWHVVAESANDYGVPKFQIERNVQSLTILPLWGLDFLNPTHGILEGTLDSAVVKRSYDTKSADILEHFVPILSSLVTLSRTRNLNRKHIEEATKTLVDLNTYFESSRNWNDVWTSDVVKQSWRELWLTEDVDDALPVSQWWDFEKPTMAQLDNALNMWQRYLFIFSIPVPEKIPDVFQASHHFTGATYGILCKVKRKCTLHIWDHCISYRELTSFLSSAISFDTPFTNSSLISLSHLACVLLEHHADVVLPCAAYFNPGWEVELGSSENELTHRRAFARKIDPVVNGICNMEKFKPIEAIKTEKPTVVMLSHIQYPKDIKNAIMAADLIVNQWGFKDYYLHIYGNMERFANYTSECQELIEAKKLGEHCVLKGMGNPSLVLEDAWLFLNSSISEGLPLAMGEAALTGVPVVCTDVGASFCVVTDGVTGDRFSEVVPPNDSESLARAQINVLGLIGSWSKFGKDAPGAEVPVLSYPTPTSQQVEAITRRMYEQADQRRALGMLGRQNVFNNFSADRYLREHEQMLWIGKYRSPSYTTRINASHSTMFGSSEWYTEKTMIGSSASSLKRPSKVPRLTAESWTSLPRPVSIISTPRSTSQLIV
jgi:glycosyltransferase involved in cell wall biosynthesis